MEPRKAPKKSEEAGGRSNLNGDVVSDTTPDVVDSIKSWRHIFESLDYEIRNCPDDFGNERTENKLRYIVESEVHKIATRMRLMPYNDMVCWDLDKIDVLTRIIRNNQGVIVDSFRPEHIQVMYKLSPTKYIYNAEFITEFQTKECTKFNQTYPNIIKDWWGIPTRFRADNHGNYAIASLNKYMVYRALMLCRLFGRKNPTHFLVGWVPLRHEVADGYSFNWGKILSDNLASEVAEYQTTKSKGNTQTSKSKG
jgi:hypothetical protein